MLSVIVPVYRAKDTLQRCVNSIINQNIKNMELILVNDGSDDGSGELCEEISRGHSNIFVVHSINVGPYQARKKGVQYSHGDIVTFVDADDWIDDGAYAYLLDEFLNDNIDILMYAYKYGHGGEEIFHGYDDGKYDKSQIKDIIIPTMIWDICEGKRKLDPSLCCKFIRRELFTRVTEFVDERIVFGDDAAVSYPMVCIADNIKIINKPYYNYCVTKKSNTRNFPVERIEELQNFKKVLSEKLKENSKFNFNYQVECYVRSFLNRLLINWFGCQQSSQMYTFPFSKFSYGEKIKLYGAGDVGKSYYTTIKQTQYVSLQGWYDAKANIIKSYNGEKIIETKRLSVNEDEKLLIAVRDESTFRDISERLNELEINKDRIVWCKPVIIG